MCKWKLALPIVMIFVISCAFDDSERCEKDQKMDDQWGYCRALTPFDKKVTRDEPHETWQGGILNLACQSSVDCVDNGPMDFCLADGFNPGVCTVSNCVSGNCQDNVDFVCCDCRQSDFSFMFPKPICGVKAYESAMGDIGCVCNNIKADVVDTDTQVVIDRACQNSSDCPAPLDFCIPNPYPDQPGFCAQSQCTAGACGIEGDQCCDCTSHPEYGWPSPLCVDSTMVGYMTPAGCSCQ